MRIKLNLGISWAFHGAVYLSLKACKSLLQLRCSITGLKIEYIKIIRKFWWKSLTRKNALKRAARKSIKIWNFESFYRNLSWPITR